MKLIRMICVLAGALVIMLVVVVLRAETTRLHYEISELDRWDDVLRQELRHEQLAWQRARDPAALWERVKLIQMSEPVDELVAPRGRTNSP
ncbi:MAG: hypothetical protein ABIG44_04625 [Planctomycetota bacterium]